MPVPPTPRRIQVVGNSGSGKTTLARRIASRLDIPHRELDAVFWAENWTKRDPEAGRALLREFVEDSPDGWVTDGNWNDTRRGLLDDADLIVWLDYPRRVTMSRVVRRTLRRNVTRRELWHGNRENPRWLLSRDPNLNIILWSWTEHDNYRERYQRLSATSEVPILRLRSPRATRAWLATLTASP